jgi:hypothetical protein
MNRQTVWVITAMVVLLAGSFLSNAVLATDNSSLVIILNHSKDAAQERMAQLQDMGNATSDIQSLYSQGLDEYQTALILLNNNTSSGEVHAFNAMNLFKRVIETSQQHVTQEQGDPSALLQNISDSQAHAQKIRVIARANGLSTDFSDYDKAINMANAFIVKNDLNSANEQLTIAENLLDQIYSKLEIQAESSKQDRAMQFLKDTQATLNQMIGNAKSLGLSQSTIDTLQATLDRLQNAKTTEEIIDTTNQSSNLQNVTDQYNDQRIVNFQKESVRIQHEIDVLHANANQMNIKFSGFIPINQILDDIKQKIAEGQTDEASQELDQVDSLVANMNDVVNGAPAIIQQIMDTRTFASSLQNRAQGNEDLLSSIDQAVQMLDSTNSLIVNATSASDLQSAKDELYQATSALNTIKDSIDQSVPANNTPSNTTSASPDNATASTNPPLLQMLPTTLQTHLLHQMIPRQVPTLPTVLDN